MDFELNPRLFVLLNALGSGILHSRTPFFTKFPGAALTTIPSPLIKKAGENTSKNNGFREFLLNSKVNLIKILRY
jgi:hypothetical protein